MERHESWVSSLSMSATGASTTTSVVTTSARLSALRDRATRARESRGVCEKVLARLYVLNRQLEHMISMSATSTGSNGSGGKHQASSQNQRALARLGELVTQLEEFVDCDATRNLVLRLTDSRRFRQLQDLHEELDAIYRMLRLEHVDPERQWRSEWTLDREDVERKFLQALATREALFREVATPDAQREALAVLRFTMKTMRLQPAAAKPTLLRGSSGTLASAAVSRGTDMTAELLRSAFRKLVSLATVDIPVLPTWFLSPAELSVEKEPFAGGEQTRVCRASWGRFKTRVAVKYVKPRGEEDERTARFREALIQEAELWSHFDHPNVLKMHGGCSVGATPFLVVEFPAHGSLDEYLLTSEDPYRTTLRLLWQAATGLQYLHERHVTCRDLKLSSLFVGSDGVAKVGQLASFFRHARSKDASAVDANGSIRWKAPELLRGDGASTTDEKLVLAADVYAFAMCIIEALTGELPWGWLADADVRDRVLAGELPERPEALNDRLWKLITVMCDPDPARRPAMGEVVKQLLAAAEEEEDGGPTGTRRSSMVHSFMAAEDLAHPDEFATSDGFRRNPTLLSTRSIDVDVLISARRNTGTMLSSPATPEDPSAAATAAPTISVVTLHHKWLGVKINSIGNRVVVSKFLRSSSGALGEIEASGQVRLGDIIVAVNNRSVRGLDRNQVGQLISSAPRPMQLMFLNDSELLEECFQFQGLRLEERWRDRGAIVPMPNGAEVTFGSANDAFTFSIWFSLSDSDDTFCGGVLLGGQDLSCQDQAWPYCHHQLIMVDPHGNLSSFFLQNETPVLIGQDLQPNRWYHMVVVYNAQGVAVYLDGEIKHQANGILFRDWQKLTHLNIGSGCISRAPPAAKPNPDFCGWYGFNGLIHDACVWHKEMSETEIQRLFRGASDFVDMPVYSLRRDVDKEARGLHPPRRVMASRPHHVVAQTYS